MEQDAQMLSLAKHLPKQNTPWELIITTTKYNKKSENFFTLFFFAKQKNIVFLFV